MAVITLNTGGQTVHRECAVPVSAMEFLRGCETEISALCGGTGRCGKCRVFARGSLSAVTEEEKRMLRPDELRDGVRLACTLGQKLDFPVVHVVTRNSRQVTRHWLQCRKHR